MLQTHKTIINTGSESFKIVHVFTFSLKSRLCKSIKIVNFKILDTLSKEVIYNISFYFNYEKILSKVK